MTRHADVEDHLPAWVYAEAEGYYLDWQELRELQEAGLEALDALVGGEEPDGFPRPGWATVQSLRNCFTKELLATLSAERDGFVIGSSTFPSRRRPNDPRARQPQASG